jgi:23S rRNA (cytidine2498-2'-O)-methyltransferase
MTDTSFARPGFVFCVCQVGMENVCKREVLGLHPYLAFAFSRPGFLTFKVQSDAELPATFELKTPFVRTSGWSIGRLNPGEPREHIDQLVERIRELNATIVHVWQRDQAIPGEDGFEPGRSPLAQDLANALAQRWAESAATPQELRINQVADHGERVFDVAIVEPDSCWLGWHTAHSVPRRWPGGVPPNDPAKQVISRAYWKMAEALQWSRLPIAAGQWCVELGAAPGGACQYLLEQGLKVIAVDPAELDERLKQHAGIIHLRCRRSED